jgi:hypothetical protein
MVLKGRENVLTQTHASEIYCVPKTSNCFSCYLQGPNQNRKSEVVYSQNHTNMKDTKNKVVFTQEE